MKHTYILCVLVALSFSFSLSAQEAPTAHPGGVKGVKAWFQTEEVAPEDNESRWVDKSGHGVKLMQDDEEYEERHKEHNFHKSLWFHRDDVYFDLLGSSGRQLTTFGLFNPYNLNSQQPYEYVLYDVVSAGNDESFNMATDKLYLPTGAVRLDYGAEEGSDLWFRADEYNKDNYNRYYTTKLLSHYKAVNPNYSLWGEDETLRVHINKSRSGANKIWYFIPEFIVYDRMLTPVERLRVESYMARKYAVPLETSYLSSDEKLIWDYVENENYNNRILYVGREDSTALYQSGAISSYEHYYFNNIEGLEGALETGYTSTTDNRGWNSRSRNRLFAFHVNTPVSSIFSNNGAYGGLNDGDYYMLGDDGGDLPIVETPDKGLAGMHTIGRTWRIRSNVENHYQNRTTWQGDDKLTVNTEDTYPMLALDNTEEAEIEQRVFTTTPLMGEYGSIECALPTIRDEAGGSIFIGFTANNSPDATLYYGFEIDDRGRVYRYEKGERDGTADGYYANRNRYIKVSLEGNELTLSYRFRGSGVAYPNTRTYTLEAADKAQLKYGLVHYTGSGNGEVISHLKTKGFVSETCPTTRIELRGYDNGTNDLGYNGMTGMPDIDPQDNRTVFLLVDPTGEGDFSHSGVKKIPANEWALYGWGRYLFDELVWDTDGNGYDAFTFGYQQGSILARIEQTDINCDTDGSLKITLAEGDTVKHALNIFHIKEGADEEVEVYADSIMLNEEKLISLADTGTYKILISNPTTKEQVNYTAQLADLCDEGEEKKPELRTDGSIIKAYPNPATTGVPFQIAFELAEPSKAVVLIFNSSGKLITQMEVPEEQIDQKVEATLHQSGLYLIKVITDTKEYNRKILIQ